MVAVPKDPLIPQQLSIEPPPTAVLMSLPLTDRHENALFAARANNGDCLLCPKAPPAFAHTEHPTPRGQSGLSPLFAPSTQSHCSLFSEERSAASFSNRLSRQGL